MSGRSYVRAPWEPLIVAHLRPGDVVIGVGSDEQDDRIQLFPATAPRRTVHHSLYQREIPWRREDPSRAHRMIQWQPVAGQELAPDCWLDRTLVAIAPVCDGRTFAEVARHVALETIRGRVERGVGIDELLEDRGSQTGPNTPSIDFPGTGTVWSRHRPAAAHRMSAGKIAICLPDDPATIHAFSIRELFAQATAPRPALRQLSLLEAIA